jgi:hypothetical protein
MLMVTALAEQTAPAPQRVDIDGYRRGVLPEAEVWCRWPRSASYILAARQPLLDRYGERAPWVRFAEELIRKGYRHKEKRDLSKRIRDEFNQASGPSWLTVVYVLAVAAEQIEDPAELRGHLASLYQRARGGPPPGDVDLVEPLGELVQVKETELNGLRRAEEEHRYKAHILRDRWHQEFGRLTETAAAAKRFRAEAEQARAQAARAVAQADQSRAEADRARADADRARAEVDQACARTAQAVAEADQARAEADQARAEGVRLRAWLEQARLETRILHDRLTYAEAEVERVRAPAPRPAVGGRAYQVQRHRRPGFWRTFGRRTVLALRAWRVRKAEVCPEPQADEPAGRYRLVRPVEHPGGASAVWIGCDDVLARDVTITRVAVGRAGSGPPERAAATAVLDRIVESLATQAHPGLPTLYDVEDRGDEQWLISERVVGCSLSRYLTPAGPLDEVEAVRIGRAAIETIKAASAVGLVARRDEPVDIVLTEGGRTVLTGLVPALPGSGGSTAIGMQWVGRALRSATAGRPTPWLDELLARACERPPAPVPARRLVLAVARLTLTLFVLAALVVGVPLVAVELQPSFRGVTLAVWPCLGVLASWQLWSAIWRADRLTDPEPVTSPSWGRP